MILILIIRLLICSAFSIRRWIVLWTLDLNLSSILFLLVLVVLSKFYGGESNINIRYKWYIGRASSNSTYAKIVFNRCLQSIGPSRIRVGIFHKFEMVRLDTNKSYQVQTNGCFLIMYGLKRTTKYLLLLLHVKAKLIISRYHCGQD